MAIKKRSNLRGKTSRLNKPKTIVPPPKPQPNAYEENPFLKLSTTTKKEKQLTRSKEFNDKITNVNSTISKSALRRRKRKAREALKPKLDEMFESLPEVTMTEQDQVFVEKKEISNQPNFRKKTGHQVIFKQEHQLFNDTLKNQQFRASPFETLKNAIKSNIERSGK